MIARLHDEQCGDCDAEEFMSVKPGTYHIAPYLFKHPYSSLVPSILLKYRTGIFIETGSNVGHGIKAALEVGFETVYSIEAVFEHYESCVQDFGAMPNVFLRHGNSPMMLEDIVSKLEHQATVYLDAHSETSNPLLDELAVLAHAARRDHVLLIDDVRMFGSDEWFGLSQQQILQAVMRVNPAYRITYDDTTNARGDLLVARV